MEFNQHPNLIVGPIRNEQLRRDRCCETINTMFAIILTIIAIGVCITISEYYRVLRETGQMMSVNDPEYEHTFVRLHPHNKSRTKIEVDLSIKICTIPMFLNCILFIWAIVLLWRSKVVKARNTRGHVDRIHIWASVSAYSSKLTLIVFLPVILFGLPDIDHKVAILFMHMLCFMFWLGQRQKLMVLFSEVMRPTQVQMSMRGAGPGRGQRSGQGLGNGNEIVIAIPADGHDIMDRMMNEAGGTPPHGHGHAHAHAHVSPFEVELQKYATAPPPSYADATARGGDLDSLTSVESGEAPPPNYCDIKQGQAQSKPQPPGAPKPEEETSVL